MSGRRLLTLRTAKELKQLHRVILGTDSPAGSGVQPLGIIRVISLLSSVGEIPAEQAICFATGNTAKMRKLDSGLIEAGRAADFVFLDRAQHSAGKTLLESIRLGDLPGIGMTIIDGVVRTQRSRNTPPATQVPTVVQGSPSTSAVLALTRARKMPAGTSLGSARDEPALLKATHLSHFEIKPLDL